MSDGEQERSRRLCRAIMLAGDCMRELMFSQCTDQESGQVMATTISQARLLRVVFWYTRTHGEGISLKDLAARLRLSPSPVSVMVENLVQRGNLERTSSTRDRRMVLIRPADGSVEAIEQRIGGLLQLAEDYLNTLTADRRKMLVDLMQEFGDYMQENGMKVF